MIFSASPPDDPRNEAWVISPGLLAVSQAIEPIARERRIALLDHDHPLDGLDHKRMVFFMLREEASLDRLEQLSREIKVPWSLITSESASDFAERCLKPGSEGGGGDFVVIIPEANVILIGQVTGSCREAPLDQCDLKRLLTERTWGVCLIYAHGEMGHMRVGRHVICSAPPDGEAVKGFSGKGCQPPASCRRGGRLIPIALHEIRANCLVTLTCGGWGIGAELFPSDLSSVRAIQAASEVQTWITSVGPLKMRPGELNTLVETLRSSSSRSNLVWLWNEIHCYRWGYKPLVHWMCHIGVSDTPSYGTPRAAALVEVIPIKSKDSLLIEPQGSKFFRSRSLVVARQGVRPSLSAPAAEFLARMDRVIQAARETSYRIGRYSAVPDWRALSDNRRIIEIMDQRITLLDSIEPLDRFRCTVPCDGVLAQEVVDLLGRVSKSLQRIDQLLAELLSDELSSGNFWQLVSPEGSLSRRPENLAGCPFDGTHPVVASHFSSTMDTFEYLDCYVCGSVWVKTEGLPEVDIQIPKAGKVGEKFQIRLSYSDFDKRAWRFIMLEENIGKRNAFLKVGPLTANEEAFDILCPADFTPEVHFILVGIVLRGAFSWHQRRFVAIPQDDQTVC